MLWTLLLSNALAGPSVDVRLERPLVHRSAWQITSSEGKLFKQTAFWNVFGGTAIGLGGRRGTSWVADVELGSRRVRWTRKSGAKEFGSTEVWGGASLAWRRGLTGARTDVAWPWAQAGLGWAFGNNGTRALDYLYTPFQGPALHGELGLELPGQRPSRPFIAMRWSGHAAIYNRRVNAQCGQLGTCYGLDGNSSAWRLGLQVGVRLGEPPEPWVEPEIIEGVGPVPQPEPTEESPAPGEPEETATRVEPEPASAPDDDGAEEPSTTEPDDADPRGG